MLDFIIPAAAVLAILCAFGLSLTVAWAVWRVLGRLLLPRD